MDSQEDFVLIDLHEPEHYQKEHIPGAINIPLSELERRAPVELSKNERLVVYGENHEAEASNKAATILEALGYRKVSDFDGGLDAWKRAGFATEGNEPEIVGELPLV
ncbi:MAG: rhodanese-like domain-containing protein [Bradymonadaceae bacterium]|nr:rhodanese-like domain-containing protein [Lujinxingiaceae bacterium]